MLNLELQHAPLRQRLSSRMDAVLASGQFVLGPEVERFEGEARDFLGVKHAVGASCGSDALVLALLALGIGPGAEVITSPFSFFATAESIVRVGARPVFADLAASSFELDPAAVNAALSPRTRAILSVPLFGVSSVSAELAALAAAHGVALIEDAAQAFGARSSGRSLGSFGALGCFSFHPAKPLGALGDAGLVVTNDAELAARCRTLRAHGSARRYEHAQIGGNFRLDALQAAVLSEQLPDFPAWLAARRHNAQRYLTELSDLSELTLPHAPSDSEPSFAQFTLRTRQRNELARFLAERGVETQIHYPSALHRQPALLALGLGLAEDALPHAEQAAREVLSLPVHPALTEQELMHVCESVRQFFSR